MAHAGFPNGVGCTADSVRDQIASQRDEAGRVHIIELDGRPIGEMNYDDLGEAAEIGIKICDAQEQSQGHGPVLLAAFIDALFRELGYRRVVLDTNLRNKRAQHVYEHKLGFKRVRVEHDSWSDQLGVPQSTVFYELDADEWPSDGRTVPEYQFRTA